MIRNFFKTAIRNLLRNKTYTTINILGLALGLSVCLIIFAIISFETGFDKFHHKKDRIYRVLTEFHDVTGVNTSAGVPFPLPQAIKAEYPQLEKVTSVFSNGNDQIIILDDKDNLQNKFKEETGVFFTDPSFFEIFDFPWITGTPSSLNEPNNAALTKSTAIKYFGDWKKAIGKTIRRNNKQDLKISGIIQDPPANTDFQLKIVVSFKTMKNPTDDWGSVSSSMGCYILLPPGLTAKKFNSQLPAFVKKYKKPDQVNDAQVIGPLSEVHFNSKVSNFLGRTISWELIRTLIFIAFFILIIACVNFINLSTAQAVNRAKEVGIRKVLGSKKEQLRIQFLTETTLIVLASVAIALVITVVTIPYIKNLLKLPLSNNIFSNPLIVLFLIIIIPLVVLLSGFYPSVVLSRFNPVNALKSKSFANASKGITLRKGLVVVQFVIAQALIIGTIVIVLQMNYFNSKPMGFDKEAIITIPFPTDSASLAKLDFLKNKLSEQKGIEKFSLGFASPAQIGNWYSNFKFDHAAKETDFGANMKWGDENYLSTFGLQLIAGHNIPKSDTTTGFIINETLLKMLGMTDPASALNKEINMWDGKIIANIIGVVKDFHSASLQQPLQPILIASNKEVYNIAAIKLRPLQVREQIKILEQVWTSIYPEYVFEYEFMDKKIASFYNNENKLSGLYKIFAAIAIFLSCLGLYGLASFMAVQRIKEVGIRKVLGASVKSVVYLFSREFITLISIAFIVASAIAYYFMKQWLQEYTYRIEISWWIFLSAGLLSLFIAILTVSSQAIKAAVANPVKSLRSE
ncbi:MAG: ABC transporter permease [Ginsengibacter sp.]